MAPIEVSVVVLTRGDRPAELERLIASVHSQRGVNVEIVLVCNGAGPDVGDEAGADTVVALPENVGIPAGRNVGAQAARYPLVAFLDDDGWLAGPDSLGRAAAHFRDEPRLATVAMRIVDEDGATARRHVPRIGGRSADRAGEVTAFLGGAVLVRASAFHDVGGYDGRFFYAMEETDLAWRLADRGWRMWYEPDARFVHPRTDPSRHPDHLERTARNRLWAAWKSLPAPLMVGYAGVWAAASIARSRSLRPVLRGYRDGWRTRPTRSPIRWATVWRLTRLGRPPVV